MSYHGCFITHGLRLNNFWTFAVPLMEAILRFVEHNVKKSQFFTLSSNWFHLYIRISLEIIAISFIIPISRTWCIKPLYCSTGSLKVNYF